MKDNFIVAIERVLGHEGGYANHPNDPGGETMWGITKRLAWKHGYRGQMRELSREMAIAIYRKAFWDKLFCDVFPFPLAFQLFDYAINSGPVKAVRDLQACCGIVDDGIIGPKTFTAFRTANLERVLEQYLSRRLAYMQSLPHWETFAKGWTNRIDLNRQFLKDDLHSVREKWPLILTLWLHSSLSARS